MGVEIVQPVSDRASDAPAATGARDANFGLSAVGKPANGPLPAPEAAAVAPDQVIDAIGSKQPPTPTVDPNAKKSKKNPKPVYDKNDESSSKHKPKKGIDKINPF